MTDAETTAAVEALAHRIRTRDEALRDGAEDTADAEPFAQEFITALRGQGWRPTEARRSKPWAGNDDGDSPLPQPDKPGGAEYLEHRRRVDAAAAQAAERRRAGVA
jgi:hypothetical protein